MRLNYNKEQLEAVIDKVAERTMNMDMTWDWPCGVTDPFGPSGFYRKYLCHGSCAFDAL